MAVIRGLAAHRPRRRLLDFARDEDAGQAPGGGLVRGRSRARSVVARHVVPLLVVAVFLLPLWYLVSGALRPLGLPPVPGAALIPRQVSLESFRSINQYLPLTTFLWNSVVIAAVAVPLSVAVAALAGFGIRTLRPGAARRATIATVVVMLVPASALWATRFQVFDSIGLSTSPLAVMAPALLAGSPLYALLYAWAFSGVADEQLWAARLDGARELTVWWRIALPQVRPTTLAVSVLAFSLHWSNFIDPLLYLQGMDEFTLSLGIRFLQLLNPTDFPLLMAAALLFTLPVIVALVVAQRALFEDPRAVVGKGHS